MMSTPPNPPVRSIGTSGRFASRGDQLPGGLCGVAFGDAMTDTVGSTRTWTRPNQTSPGKARTHAVLAAPPGKSPIDFRDKNTPRSGSLARSADLVDRLQAIELHGDRGACRKPILIVVAKSTHRSFDSQAAG